MQTTPCSFALQAESQWNMQEREIITKSVTSSLCLIHHHGLVNILQMPPEDWLGSKDSLCKLLCFVFSSLLCLGWRCEVVKHQDFVSVSPSTWEIHLLGKEAAPKTV